MVRSVRPAGMVCCFFLLSFGPFATAQFKLYEKGHDIYVAGKYPEAIRLFSEYLTKATRDKAIDIDVFYLRALSYYKTGDFKSSIPDFEETILRGHANKGNIYWFMAKGYDKMGDAAESRNYYDNAIREMKDNRESLSKLYSERGDLLARTGDVTAAREDYERVLQINPGNQVVRKEMEKLGASNVSSREATSHAKPATTAKKDSNSESVKKVPQVKAPTNEASAGEKAAVPQSKAAQTPSNDDKVQRDVLVAGGSAPLNPALADIYRDEKRYALVIGNSGYPQNIGVLRNPVNDATDVARELENSNFQVQLLTNATYGQIRAALMKFKEKMDGGDPEKTVALFYFAGHGLQYDDENYIVPVDASVEFADDIVRYCFPVQRMVLQNMERANTRMNIVILDACRNNPFPSLTRSAGSGLGEMKRARGSFIAYATAPGSVASDGTGRNGLYTQELLKAMRKPGLTIEQVFKEVRANVLKQSGNKQNTWDSSNIIGEFHFKF